MHIRLFHHDDTESVIQLWERCGLLRPWNDPHRDIERKLSINDGLFIVGTTEDMQGLNAISGGATAPVVIGAAMGGYDGHRGWVNYLAVEPTQRQAGLGRQLMADLEAKLLARGCPKLNLQVRSGNSDVLAFYQQLGYSVDEAVSLGKRLIPDQ